MNADHRLQSAHNPKPFIGLIDRALAFSMMYASALADNEAGLARSPGTLTFEIFNAPCIAKTRRGVAHAHRLRTSCARL